MHLQADALGLGGGHEFAATTARPLPIHPKDIEVPEGLLADCRRRDAEQRVVGKGRGITIVHRLAGGF